MHVALFTFCYIYSSAVLANQRSSQLRDFAAPQQVGRQVGGHLLKEPVANCANNIQLTQNEKSEIYALILR